MLRGALFVQLIFLWSSSRSGERGPTVVPASSSLPLLPPLHTSPVSSPYAKMLLPFLWDLNPDGTFLYLCRLGIEFKALFHAAVRLQVFLKEATRVKSGRDMHWMYLLAPFWASLSLLQTHTMENKTDHYFSSCPYMSLIIAERFDLNLQQKTVMISSWPETDDQRTRVLL